MQRLLTFLCGTRIDLSLIHILAKGMGAFPQLYPCDNLECDCWTVYTNRPAAGAMRGYGIPQAMWAGECHIDDICQAIGMEPMEFRRKNLMPVGRCV